MNEAIRYFNDVRKGAFAFFMACVLMLSVTASMVAGCTASQVQADIEKVISELPTALNIAESIITIVSGVKGQAAPDPALVAQATAIVGQISADLKLADTVLGQYQANLPAAPVSVIKELDTAVADVQTNLGQILTALHIVDTRTAEAVGFAVAGIQGVILALESVLPASAASLFPKVSASLRAIGSAPGALHVKLESGRSVAKSFNKRVKPLFPKAQVPVPAMHFLGIPL